MEGITTPYGVALQSTDAPSLALRARIESGAPLFRQGSLEVQETAAGQFWSGQNPLVTRGYAQAYGTPGASALGWVMGGTARLGARFVTRPAPGLGSNLGGAPEAVFEPGGVTNFWFHMVGE